MNLIITSELSEPPSNVTCFRDVTLYAKTFVFEDVLLQCKPGTRSFYWKWLKRYGAHDFVSCLITTYEKEAGFKISSSRADLVVDKINYNNLTDIISTLVKLKK